MSNLTIENKELYSESKYNALTKEQFRGLSDMQEEKCEDVRISEKVRALIEEL